MPRRGKKKRRARRGRDSAAAQRASSMTSVGGLPLWLLCDEGLLHPSTEHDTAGRRVRASPAERAHVDRLRDDPDTAARPRHHAGER